MEVMILKESKEIVSDSLQYHIDNGISIHNSIYRYAKKAKAKKKSKK